MDGLKDGRWTTLKTKWAIEKADWPCRVNDLWHSEFLNNTFKSRSEDPGVIQSVIWAFGNALYAWDFDTLKPIVSKDRLDDEIYEMV